MPAEAEMIVTPERLKGLAARLGQEPLVACDLEADSLHHYQEKVCLIQFAIPGAAMLLDPLVLPDISPVAPVFANPAVRKIFHGADYDIRSLDRDFSIEVNNLFDTMIACQFLGEKEFGLAAVLKKRFGVELDKQYQKADWSKRPLSREMLEYAIKDTSLLIALYRQLEDELRKKGRLAWVEEECAVLSRVRSSQRGEEPLFYRFKGASKMEPRTLAVLEELLGFRDRWARQGDIPPFKVLGTETVRELAVRRPRIPADLTGIPGLTGKVVERYGDGILRAIAKGCAVPAGELPVYPREERRRKSRLEDERLKRLKSWREEKARKLGVETGVLANNTLLEHLALAAPRSCEELAAIPLRGWQQFEFGAELVNIVNSCR